MVSQKGSDMLYVRVTRITQVYLGPAADRFVARQIRNHLRKNPEQLARKDLNDLIDWIRVAMGYITEDSELVNEYVDKLKALV
jgi:hypothetical protein